MEGLIYKTLFALFLALVAIIEPTFPFAIVVFIAILMDCWSAFDLNRRLKKQYPENVTGKFQSRFALKMFKTFMQVYSVIILLFLVDTILLRNLPYFNLADIGAAVFCALQLLSILENLSSANGAKWAKAAQKILIDKSKRHFNIDLSDNQNNYGNGKT